MSPTETPPGWHPDPADPVSSMRWWDGTQWTSHVLPVTAPAPGPSGAPARTNGGPSGPNGARPGPSGQNGTNPGWYGPTGPPEWSGAQVSFARRNQRSLTAAGVATLYIIVAVVAHLVFFGILPLILSIRAWQARETLAPLAIAVTVVAILIGVVGLTGR
jgi:Protein of unknown function (DUF2510)